VKNHVQSLFLFAIFFPTDNDSNAVATACFNDQCRPPTNTEQACFDLPAWSNLSIRESGQTTCRRGTRRKAIMVTNSG
jgi:hypothetical protein